MFRAKKKHKEKNLFANFPKLFIQKTFKQTKSYFGLWETKKQVTG